MKGGCSVVSWNCRGAKRSQFSRSIRYLVACHKTAIILILEPRISGTEADVVCRRIGRYDWVRSEARGFSGGLWMFWDRQEVEITVVHVEYHFIHVHVSERGG